MTSVLRNSWEAAMLQEDFPAAWHIADAVVAGRDPATRDDAGLPYHERWVWDGSPLEGQAVTVRCYHGLGDTIQFVRYLPALRARAAHVTLEVQPELLALLRPAPGHDRIVKFDVAAPVPASTAIEIMELPHALRLRPPPAPYLTVSARAVPGARTGVCWQSGGWDPARSISLDVLSAVLPSDAVSLQRGAAGLPDPLAGTMDITATAGLIAGLDRVITVDTMVAHLAGALGRRVHLLLRHEADWRWGLRSRTSWYGGMRLHRQGREGDWSAAVDSLRAALAEEG